MKMNVLIEYELSWKRKLLEKFIAQSRFLLLNYFVLLLETPSTRSTREKRKNKGRKNENPSSENSHFTITDNIGKIKIFVISQAREIKGKCFFTRWNFLLSEAGATNIGLLMNTSTLLDFVFQRCIQFRIQRMRKLWKER